MIEIVGPRDVTATRLRSVDTAFIIPDVSVLDVEDVRKLSLLSISSPKKPNGVFCAAILPSIHHMDPLVSLRVS